MQIYRHMNIGTEKPSPEQLQSVRHHMIDIVEPSERFSAGRYIETVLPIIRRLHSEQKVPVFAGGTGLYIKAMTRGLFAGPSADDALREELRQEPVEALYRRLEAKDPEAAGNIKPTDKRRIIRALEVCILSGKRFSELKGALTQPLPYTFVKVALTRNRKELYRMIDARVDDMMKRGLEAEVRHIISLSPTEVPMQAIGYKELAAHLRGEYSLEEAVRLIKRNTRRYAKRQFTWFGGEPDLFWLDITGISDPRESLSLIIPVLRQAGIAL